ncbi:MAG TPA: hydantoinase/oxoprolinase family protein [Burkholderiales bacterium]|nr:hydantoinase/oxoprolinase family protein [Burkholderiales bacterium]
MTALSLAIDIGGTFTDIVVYDPQASRHYIYKEYTTPDDPARGVLTGVRALLERDRIPASSIKRVVHATTLFTNALIERKGAKCGLITTEGFRDVLEIQTERKYELYDIFIEMPRPLIPRLLCREVPERMSELGEVETPLDIDALQREADLLVEHGIESVAVMFLHSYVNPAHEQAVLDTLARRHPQLHLTASFEVAPEIREYERLSTTVANAYIKPLAQRYLDRLAGQIRELGIDAPFLLMLSNGGLTDVAEAKRTPIQLLESGPAAGVLAATYFGGESGIERQLAFDMGGTTAKASLVDGGEPLIAYRFEAAREKRFTEGSGLPIKTSTIELIEIGAGGGSIAHIDELGLLKVGPESAGAMPGAACYGRGGTQPTVTDADLLLGYLNPDFFLGGTIRIDKQAAEAAFADLRRKTGMSTVELAWGIHDIVNENMASAARVHIATRGRDPRHYTLMATGGAGPVHAYHVARKVNVRQAVCPPAAGVGSAMGLLMAPARIDRVASMVSLLDRLDWKSCEETYRELESAAAAVLARTGADMSGFQVKRLADMRYFGQQSEVVVALPRGPYSEASRDGIAAAFETAYRDLFVRTPPQVAIQLVNVRVSVSAPVPGGGMALRGSRRGSAAEARKGYRKVYFPDAGGFIDSDVYDRYRLPVGARLEGPAVVEEKESTLVFGPRAVCEVHESGSLVLTLPAAGA